MAQTVIAFVRDNQEWAAPIVFLLAFAESLVLVSLLFPATVMLWGVGALIGVTGINFVPIWIGASLGAGLGSWISYWIGFHFHTQIAGIWPLSRNPKILARGHDFFRKWGMLGVFIGQFFGPLRAAVPVAAGACMMDRTQFHIANWSSAFVWGAVVLAPGALGVEWLRFMRGL